MRWRWWRWEWGFALMLLNMASCAVNMAMFAARGKPWNLGAGIIAGFTALLLMLLVVRGIGADLDVWPLDGDS